MSAKLTSLLLISKDESFHTALGSALPQADYSVTSQRSSVVGLNGSAARLASHHDIILFDWDQDDPASLSAAREMCDARAAGSMLIALAGQDLPLFKARQISRAGVDDVLPRDSLTDEIIPQIESWRLRQSAKLPAVWAGQATLGKVIAVAQARGGVGSSTLAVNLADVLQGDRGLLKRKVTNDVALVDLDFQFGSIAALVDVEESDAMWRMAMEGTVPDAAFIEQAIVKTSGGLSVLTAPSRFGPLNALTSKQIGAVLDELRKTHDYVVVDLPRALVEWIEPVLSRADKLLLATDVTVPSVRAARKLIDFYLLEHPGLSIEMVASHEKKPLVAASHHRAATELLQLPFSHWIPDDPKAAREALDRGKPLGEVAPRSRIARAIRGIGRATATTLAPRQAHH